MKKQIILLVAALSGSMLLSACSNNAIDIAPTDGISSSPSSTTAPAAEQSLSDGATSSSPASASEQPSSAESTSSLSVEEQFSSSESVPSSTAASETEQDVPAQPVPSSTASPAAQPAQEPSSNVSNSVPRVPSAIDLYNEFKADIPSMTDKYTGEKIEVSGIVVYTGSDVYGIPSIELSDTAGGKSYILCDVNSFDQLSEVSVGDSVVMRGNFHVFGSDDWVVLKRSEILE